MFPDNSYGRALFLTAAYVSLVVLLRFKRLSDLHAKFAHLLVPNDKQPLLEQRLAYTDAQEILHVSEQWDMPWMLHHSLEFALFKAFGIPTVSKVLVHSAQIPLGVGRRAEDTACILNEMMAQGIDSVRGSTALCRMNFLHSRHGSSIKTEDIIYVMSLFIFEPIDWTHRYEWRSMSELEQAARFVWWSEIGARMGVPPHLLPQSLFELREWTETYEIEHMVFAPSNKECATATRDLFLRPLPQFAQAFGCHAVSALLSDRLRISMGFEEPPQAYRVWMPRILKIRGWLIRWFALPRWQSWSFGEAEVKGDPGRYTRADWVFEPWYVAPKLGSYLRGLISPVPPSSGFHQQGYRVEELGPEKLRGQGREAVIGAASKMRARANGGKCPFRTNTTP
ncbi:hypothetical protein BOTBODRAFT_32117 [Botryobasidium botryosum FD-172 SS1]|uniref:ER-bound oxygenase mpaB/mpaB'/Rubber oxygenase catalytic domain-containing protein n=1 Tax=Botryobasidium botryosum (strain FD-172 SS1) TaxID=930990 RepID=A0A067MH68_BOTB1|nr:hypothetical protein BOTBODRAFT_32117 [Botryobasidium botryosum FD-172 SS1]